MFAITSAFSGNCLIAWLSAASASSKRPRWISETACDSRASVAAPDGACAISSKT